MRVLMLHGRGSNNGIFRMQTGGFRNHLEDWDFEFAQGQLEHNEGNWMLHTKDFAADKLWGYYNALDLDDVLRTEEELLELALEDGPYDGVVGYSQGAQLAAQVMIRFQRNNPNATLDEMPFRFMIFFNAATPSEVFVPTEPLEPLLNPDLEDPDAAMFLSLMKKNPLMKNLDLNGTMNPYSLLKASGADASDVPSIAKAFGSPIWPVQTKTGRQCLTNGRLAAMKINPAIDGVLIKKVATLHVRCLGDFIEFGEGMYRLCDPNLAQQYFHEHKHDFPRGFNQMKEIAALIRSTAERVS